MSAEYPAGYTPMTGEETNRLWHEIPWGEATLRAYAIAKAAAEIWRNMK